jgi:hypothetical protein
VAALVIVNHEYGCGKAAYFRIRMADGGWRMADGFGQRLIGLYHLYLNYEKTNF